MPWTAILRSLGAQISNISSRNVCIIISAMCWNCTAFFFHSQIVNSNQDHLWLAPETSIIICAMCWTLQHICFSYIAPNQSNTCVNNVWLSQKIMSILLSCTENISRTKLYIRSFYCFITRNPISWMNILICPRTPGVSFWSDFYRTLILWK